MLAAAALEYAAAGHRVFPIWGVRADGSCCCPRGADCHSIGKHPCGDLVRAGHLDATDDEATIERWWSLRPDCNVGLACGHTFFVVDCDRTEKVDGTQTFADVCPPASGVPDAAIAITGGGGQHLFFAVDDAARVGCRNGWRPGVDVKGEGGYVVAPPSRHASGRDYAWETSILESLPAPPPWLLALLSREVPPRDVADRPPAGPSDDSRPPLPPPAHSLADADVAEIERALEAIPANCDRQTWVERVSMPLHDMFAGSDHGFDVWHRWCQRGRGQTTPNGNPAYTGERECRIVWRSFSTRHRNPKGRATFWAHAASCGYVSPSADGAPPATNGHHYVPPPIPTSSGDDAAELKPWRDPEPLQREADGAVLDLDAAYPSRLWWLRDYVREIARLVQVRPELPAMLSLGLASGAYGRVLRLRLDGTDWVEYSPLWVICAFQSGGGKSPVFRPLRAPFAEWDASVDQQQEMDAWQARRDFAQAQVAHAQREVNRAMKRAEGDMGLRESLRMKLTDARRAVSEVEDMRPPSRRVLASSLTTPAMIEFLQEHQERCLIVDPEGGIFQYVLGGRTDLDKDLDPWVKAFSCEAIQQNRIGDGKHRARERRVRWPCLSMAICTQVSSLKMFGDQYAQGKGFLARFMPAVFASELPEQAIVSGRVPQSLQDRWRHEVHRLLSMPVPADEPTEVVLDGDGAAMFRRWVQAWLDRARSDPDHDAASVVGWSSPAGAKLRSFALRLVLLFHALSSENPSSDPIDPEIVRCVLDGWMPFLVQSAAQTFGMVRDDPDLQIAERVLRFLVRRPRAEFSRSEVFLNLKSASTHLATVDRVNALNGALGALSDAGWIQPLTKLTPRGPGVPPAASRYAVHPEMLDHARRLGFG